MCYDYYTYIYGTDIICNDTDIICNDTDIICNDTDVLYDGLVLRVRSGKSFHY